MPAIYINKNQSFEDALKKFKSKNKGKIEEYKAKTAYISKPEERHRKEYAANKKRTKRQNNAF